MLYNLRQKGVCFFNTNRKDTGNSGTQTHVFLYVCVFIQIVISFILCRRKDEDA